VHDRKDGLHESGEGGKGHQVPSDGLLRVWLRVVHRLLGLGLVDDLGRRLVDDWSRSFLDVRSLNLLDVRSLNLLDDWSRSLVDDQRRNLIDDGSRNEVKHLVTSPRAKGADTRLAGQSPGALLHQGSTPRQGDNPGLDWGLNLADRLRRKLVDDGSRSSKLVDDLSRNINKGDNPGLHGLKHLVVALGGVVCCPRVLVLGRLGVNVHVPVDLVHVHVLVDALGVPLGGGT
jgi:hypothetical protein